MMFPALANWSPYTLRPRYFGLDVRVTPPVPPDFLVAIVRAKRVDGRDRATADEGGARADAASSREAAERAERSDSIRVFVLEEVGALETCETE